jgi:diacylglycerol kinase
MKTSKKSGFLQSFGHALRGCAMLFGSERNARIHLVAFALVVTAGFWFEINNTEWTMIILASGAVIAAEAMNTAVESTIDLVHPHHGEKAGRIKDIAAGAVLIVTISAIIVGVIVFYPRIKALF